MSELPLPYEWTRRPPTFRQFLDMLSRPRGVADDGRERYNPAVSRPLRLFIRAQPKDHNAEDLVAVVPDDLRAELSRLVGLYEAMTTPSSALVARALRNHMRCGS